MTRTLHLYSSVYAAEAGLEDAVKSEPQKWGLVRRHILRADAKDGTEHWFRKDCPETKQQLDGVEFHAVVDHTVPVAVRWPVAAEQKAA